LDQRFSSWLLSSVLKAFFFFSLFNCFGYKTFNAFKFITELSIISPDLSGVLALKQWSIFSHEFNFTSVASAMVMDFHFRKITIFIATFCFESADQAPIE
jgi:hypothetical protein